MTRRQVVAFDIETMGLLHECPLPEITCICLYDGTEAVSLRFMTDDADERARATERVIALLDGADRIVGYNAVGFDLEFMRRSLSIDDARMREWRHKCVDPYLCALYAVGVGGSMQRMLELNGLGSKTADGGSAITMAREGRWDELLHYCQMDAQLVYALVTHREWTRLTRHLECRFLDAPYGADFRLVVQQAPRRRRAALGTIALDAASS
jgi:hypothetical protein